MGLFDDLTGKDTKKKGNALGFFAFLDEIQNKDNENKKIKELRDQGLDDWQIKEVLSGNFEPEDFEEEELEEDSYYEDEER